MYTWQTGWARPASADSRDYTLTIASAHGNPTPSRGTNAFAWRATVTCAVERVADDGGGRFVSTGWSGTGAVPATGATNTTGGILLGQLNSYLTWNWLEVLHNVAFDLGDHGTRSGGATLTQTVSHGAAATAPDVSVDEGWRLLGWAPSFAAVTNDLLVQAQYERITYAVTFRAGPHGRLAGGGPDVVVTVNHGDEAPAAPTVTPEEGYDFTGWSPALPGTIRAAEETTAQYALKTYSITATAGPFGAIEPPGVTQVSHGSSQLFTLTPQVNYHVADVLVDDVSVGATNTYLFTNVTNAHSIGASFAIDRYTLAVATPYGVATPTGVTTSDWNTVIAAVVAGSPVDGGAGVQYACTGWQGTGAAPENGSATNVSFNLTNNATLTWQWETQYQWTVSAAANGSVLATNGWFAGGTRRTTWALPGRGYAFSGWTGDVPADSTNSNPLTVTLDRARTVTANFALIARYAITASADANGAIAPPGVTQVSRGGSQVYTLTPVAHYHVADLLVDGVSVGATNTYLFTDVTNDHTIAGSFAIDRYTLTVATPYGTATPLGVTTSDWSTAIAATVAGSPVGGGAGVQYACTGWQGTGAAPASGGETNVSFNLTNDASLAWLWQTQYQWTVSATVGGSVMATNGWFAGGATRTARAEPNAGYFFTGWTGDVPAGSTNSNPLTVPLDRARSVTGTFALKTYTITATASPYGAIAPAGAVQAVHGTSPEFTMTANPGCRLMDVRVDGESVGAVGSYVFTSVAGDHAIAASFATSLTWVVRSPYGEPAPAGTNVIWSGTLVSNVVAAAVANGATQYVCQGWALEGQAPAAGTSNAVVVVATNNAVLSWQWGTNYWVGVVTNGSGTVAPAGWLTAGTTVTVRAQGTSGALFTGWTGDVVADRFASNLTLRVDHPYRLVAGFSDDPDGDGLSNPAEVVLGTDPWNPDTDGDGFEDGWEAGRTWSPTQNDRAVLDYIRAHKDVFGLYTKEELGDLALGRLLIESRNGMAQLRLQLRAAPEAGGSWTNAGAPVIWELPVAGDRKLFRVRADEPPAIEP